jgi:hypothetical protein
MALGSHPDARFVGEVGQAISGFYQPVAPTQDTLNWHNGQFGRPTKYSGTVLCHECGDGCPVWKPDEYPLDPRTAHRTIAERSGTSVLIDSTKYAFLYRRFRRAEVDSWTYVLLIKTPERQLASFRRNSNLVGEDAANRYCYTYNEAMMFLQGRSFIVSDYTEFGAHPLELLERVAAQAGLAPGKIDPVDYRSRTKYHQISGNWRASQAKAPIHVDETWVDLRAEIDEDSLERMRDTYRMVTGHAPVKE